MSTRDVIVTQIVRVEMDDTKFTPQFMEEFRASMYPLDTIDEHREHLAQLWARGVIDNFTDFIEGYGPPADFGLKFATESCDTEVPLT